MYALSVLDDGMAKDMGFDSMLDVESIGMGPGFSYPMMALIAHVAILHRSQICFTRAVKS